LRLKRYPWMTREDQEMLEQLPPHSRRAMERLLYNQAHSDKQFHARHVTGGLEDLERMAGARSCSAFGTGGGRIRRPRVEPS
jgi:hypothetical protein